MKHVFYDISPEGAKNFIKALIVELKPNGICQEGEFSSLYTDLPFSEEINELDGFTFAKFDLHSNEVSYMEYESCTGSIMRIYILASGAVVGYFENVGHRTYARFIEACKTVFSSEEEPIVFIPAEAVRAEDSEIVAGILKQLYTDRTFRLSCYGHLNPWHWSWVSQA